MASISPTIKTGLWGQFGAVIDYLGDTIAACPDSLWRSPLWLTPETKPEHVLFGKPEFSQFWYVAYHTLFWLDLYLTGSEEGFLPPPHFTLIEQHEDGPLPERVYTQTELLAYLADCRQRCRETIDSLTEESAAQICDFAWGSVNFFELLLYNMRHVHGHAAQLSMLLGQNIGPQDDYVIRARDSHS